MVELFPPTAYENLVVRRFIWINNDNPYIHKFNILFLEKLFRGKNIKYKIILIKREKNTTNKFVTEQNRSL